MKTNRLFFIAAFLLFNSLLFAQGTWETYDNEVIGTQLLRTGNVMQNFIEDRTGDLWVGTSTVKGYMEKLIPN